MGIQLQTQHQINKVSLMHVSVSKKLAGDANSRCLRGPFSGHQSILTGPKPLAACSRVSIPTPGQPWAELHEQAQDGSAPVPLRAGSPGQVPFLQPG